MTGRRFLVFSNRRASIAKRGIFFPFHSPLLVEAGISPINFRFNV